MSGLLNRSLIVASAVKLSAISGAMAGDIVVPCPNAVVNSSGVDYAWPIVYRALRDRLS